MDDVTSSAWQPVCHMLAVTYESFSTHHLQLCSLNTERKNSDHFQVRSNRGNCRSIKCALCVQVNFEFCYVWWKMYKPIIIKHNHRSLQYVWYYIYYSPELQQELPPQRADGFRLCFFVPVKMNREASKHINLAGIISNHVSFPTCECCYPGGRHTQITEILQFVLDSHSSEEKGGTVSECLIFA